MIFPVEIQIEKDGTCGETCMFKKTDTSPLIRTGECLLFNNGLNPELEYGGVVGWVACQACRDATINKVEF